MSTHLIPAIGSRDRRYLNLKPVGSTRQLKDSQGYTLSKKKKKRKEGRRKKTEQGLIGFVRWKHQEFKFFLCYTNKANLGNMNPFLREKEKKKTPPKSQYTTQFHHQRQVRM